jgi:hypothetical protein
MDSSQTMMDPNATILPSDRMSRFQVAFISATLSESDTLVAHINSYLSSRRHYGRDWNS